MPWDRNQMAERAALELEDGFYVNLGIGIPTLVSNYVPEDYDITLQSENGMLGMGAFPTEEERDPDLINAGTLKGRWAGITVLDIAAREVAGFNLQDGGAVVAMQKFSLDDRADRRIWKSTAAFDGRWRATSMHQPMQPMGKEAVNH